VAADDAERQEDVTAAPRLGRFPSALRWPLTALWLLCFAATILVQGAGIWVAFHEEIPLDDLLMQTGTGLIACLALLIAAALLVRRDRGAPVAYLLSLSCLSAAAYLGAAPILYAWFELATPETILPSLWIGLLVAALPAFPDGRFVPGWSNWLTRLALPFTLAISIDAFTEDEGVILATTILGFGVALTAVVAAVIRFRRTSQGLEKQQLKWAALVVGGCIILLIAAIGLSYAADAELFSEEWLPWLHVAILAMRDISFVVLALGLLVSVLRLRLWDADRAIGRSAAYFILTLFIALLWAATSALVNDFVSAQVGSSNKGLSAAVSTLIALLAFGPARERVNKWVEARLQRGVVQLRKLPDRLAVWQHLDDPAAFGERVVRTVAGSLHASRCAVLLFDETSFRTLATWDVAPEVVDRWTEAQGSFAELEAEQRDDPDFPIRMILTDEDVLIGALLVGRRSDGSFYAKEERETLFKLEPPLAAALHRVRTRTQTSRAVGTALADLDQRLERVESAVGGPA
jgi:hypothetical protein